MCGIAGFIQKGINAADAVSVLGCMLGRIRHRGPDGEGRLVVVESGIYTGMRRLSIIDLEGGHQPVWNERNDIAVLFNGEIYNFVELRDHLVEQGHTFRTESDTEVLVHLYEQYGTEMFSHLRGMFGFALFDFPSHRCLIARDHFGQKPLYYHLSPGLLAFASEAKALFCHPQIHAEPDPEAFLDYMSWLRLPAPMTHFKGISRLGPGQYLDIPLQAPEKATVRTYWEFQFSSQNQFLSMKAAADALDAALENSCRIHVRSDVPVGLMLSGGLDSRTIGEFSKQYLPGGFHTFSVTSDSDVSEGPAAKASSRAIGSHHHEVFVSYHDLESMVSDVAYHMDEPIADPAAFAVLKLCREARLYVKVLLGGEGADELFGGYAGRYQSVVSSEHRSAWMRRIRWILPKGSRARLQTRWQRLCYRAHSTAGQELVEGRIEGLPGKGVSACGLSDTQLHRLSNRAASLAKNLLPSSGSILDRAQILDLRWQLPESLLAKSDKMSMAASLELRCPFLDPMVAAVAARLPGRMRLRDGEGKCALRAVLQRRLGENGAFPKRGFPLPLSDWLRGPFRPRIEELLRRSAAPQPMEILSRHELQRGWSSFLMGQDDLAESFYALWLYDEWLRSFCKPNLSSSNCVR